MSDKAEGKTDGAGQDGIPADAGELANALKFERAKNKVLLDEVIALEDEIVNRSMEDFDAVVSDETREFWREQLLSNRTAATAALNELARAKGSAGDGGSGAQRRPLHNRAIARPAGWNPGREVAPRPAPGDGDDRAAKIRNRAHEISKNERVPFSAAFRRAEKELGSK